MSTGITFGAWDLLHAGHHHFLRSCAMECDEFIVGLHIDPSIERPDIKEKPVQGVMERYWQLQNLDFIAAIIPYETEKDLANILAMTQPLDYYFLGTDYAQIKLPERIYNILDHFDIEIKYIHRLHDFSSTDLRKRIRAKK